MSVGESLDEKESKYEKHDIRIWNVECIVPSKLKSNGKNGSANEHHYCYMKHERTTMSSSVRQYSIGPVHRYILLYSGGPVVQAKYLDIPCICIQ